MPSETKQLCSVISPGHKNLFFYRMKGLEELGRPFEYEVDLLSKEKLTDIGKFLLESMTIALPLPRGGMRYFHGIVTQFKSYGAFEDFFLYRAVLRPKLWLLTRTFKSRIFSKKTARQVIEMVLKEHGILFKMSAAGIAEKSEYCVQYRETDFDFISRLMEQEGIYYYFGHTQNGHEMQLTDSMNSHKAIADYAAIPYLFGQGLFNEAIQEWHFDYQVTASEYKSTDFDFEKPASPIRQKTTISKKGSQGSFDDYLVDCNDKNVEAKELNKYARTRLEELQTDYETFRGKSTAMAMTAGMLFSLSGHYQQPSTAKNVVVSVVFMIASGAYRSGGSPFANIPFANVTSPNTDEIAWEDLSSDSGAGFECSFTAISSVQQFRPRRITPAPAVHGAQTAIVTEECDKYGRVKIKFHWCENGASCWVRVSQPMAGKKWGWIALPKVGQEVIVSFEEGNPNRPIITGRVYNGDQMPPYELPQNSTQSGIKTERSNELRFEDKSGEEEIYLHAQKDLKCVIVNNETRDIKKDRKSTVTGDDSLKVTGKCTVESSTSIELKVGSNSIKIDQQGITIKGVKVSIQGDATLDAKSPMTTVSGDGVLTLKGALTKIN